MNFEIINSIRYTYNSINSNEEVNEFASNR